MLNGKFRILKLGNKKYYPWILSVALYLLIYIGRLYQGGWEIQTEIFKPLRNEFDQQIIKSLPSPQSQLLSGILLGQKKDLPPKFKLSLRDTSTLHIVVVSGQNLTMLAGVFLGLAGVLSRKSAVVIAMLAIIFYTLLTGAQVPVIRAAFMSGISFVAVFLGRQKDAWWLLLISGGIMLLINPAWLKDLSFQLSFLATIGVVMVSPAVLRLFRALPNFIRQDLSITIGAQLMVVPIIAQSFHQFSVVGVITNLLIGWTVPIVMILGALMLIFSYIFPEIAQILAFFTNLFLTYFVFIVEFFASLSFSWVYVGSKSIFFWLGYYLVILGILLLIKQHFREFQAQD